MSALTCPPTDSLATAPTSKTPPVGLICVSCPSALEGNVALAVPGGLMYLQLGTDCGQGFSSIWPQRKATKNIEHEINYVPLKGKTF